ncbi:MAG: DMT family transporter [Bryobacteraceae bacterium]
MTEVTGPRNRLIRAYRLLALVLVLRPFGNLSLAWGMRHFSQALSTNPFLYVRAMMNPYVALGILALILALLTRMALLSLADLSFVLPLTAMGYIVTTVLGKFFLREQVSLARWIGTLLIFLGTVVVGSTSRKNNGVTSSLLPREQ